MADEQQTAADVATATLEGPHGQRLVVLARPGEQHRVFRRRAVKPFAKGGAIEAHWLVGELDGVRAYLDIDAEGRASVVLTRLDLNP